LRLQRRPKLRQCLTDLRLQLDRPHRRQHRASRADEKLVVKQRPQPRQRAAHRGLADTQPGGGCRDAAFGYQRLERHHQVEVDPLQIHRCQSIQAIYDISKGYWQCPARQPMLLPTRGAAMQETETKVGGSSG